jgi:hypothetical protein
MLKGMPTSPTRPSTRRIITALAAAIIAVLALLTATAPPAHGATGPVYAGNGWKAFTSAGVYSLSPNPYVIVFADDTARTKLAGYFTGPASQVTTDVGVPITVSTLLDTTPATSCPTYHRIVVHYTYRPTGQTGVSQGRPCYAVADGSAWGGHVLVDSEYWSTPAWFSTDATKNEGYRKNAVTHELGHVLGLDHPNEDRDKDSAVESYECVTTATGTRPLMCAPNGGYYNPVDAGRFTPPFDLPGLKQMLANWYLRKA